LTVNQVLLLFMRQLTYEFVLKTARSCYHKKVYKFIAQSQVHDEL